MRKQKLENPVITEKILEKGKEEAQREKYLYGLKKCHVKKKRATFELIGNTKDCSRQRSMIKKNSLNFKI